MRLVINSKFAFKDRKFIVTGLGWFGGKADKIYFREIFYEPEPTEIFERDYDYMQSLLDNNTIIHL